MAGAKELKRRILSVKNTRKITRTMEMVATAKSKRMSDRVNGAQPYALKVGEIMESLADLGSQIESPYLRTVAEPKRVALLVVTANRGLCGGYNSNALKVARLRVEEHRKAGREVEVHMVGKKGIAYFKFLKIDVARKYLNIDDRFQYEDAEEIASGFMQDFADGKLDKVEVVSTVYHSSARQTPELTPVLPVGVGASDGEDDSSEQAASPSRASVLYEPDPAIILQRLLPLVVKTIVYRALLEAVTSEQIARRIAMKSATDNAGDMIKLLTRIYNRARQAKITQEISEIVAGADALG